MMKRLLFVCLGNICRSPAGENVMRHLLNKYGVSEISVDSAGTADYHLGKGPDARMAAVLSARGVPVTGKARQFTVVDFDRFDLILAMDEDNRREILRLARHEKDRAKVKAFIDYSTVYDFPEVPDPYYGVQEDFEIVADIMEDCCEELLRELGVI